MNHMKPATIPKPGAVSYAIATHECVDLIRSEPVGRICVLEHGFPIAFPVNYRVADENGVLRIVMRTAPETAIGRHRGCASLQVDQIALDAGHAWSVIVRGQLRPLLGDVGSVDPEPLVPTIRTDELVRLLRFTSPTAAVTQTSSPAWTEERTWAAVVAFVPGACR